MSEPYLSSVMIYFLAFLIDSFELLNQHPEPLGPMLIWVDVLEVIVLGAGLWLHVV